MPTNTVSRGYAAGGDLARVIVESRRPQGKTLGGLP